MDAALEQDIRELGIRIKRQIELFPVIDSTEPSLNDEIIENSKACLALSLKIEQAANITSREGDSAVALLGGIVDYCKAQGSDAADDLGECMPVLEALLQELPADVCPTDQNIAEAARKVQQHPQP